MAPREALHASLVANQRAVMRRVTSLQAAVAKNADIGAKARRPRVTSRRAARPPHPSAP